MPQPGGAADKLGNRYEGKWTILCLCYLLRGKYSDMEIDNIHLEPPAPEGEGVEFVLQGPDGPVYHQVKRQRSKTAGWTLSALREDGVLDNCWKKLRDPKARFCFVSTHQATILAELTDGARSANSYSEFAARYLNSKAKQDGFSDLEKIWAKKEDAPLGDVIFERDIKQEEIVHEKKQREEERKQKKRQQVVFEYLRRIEISTIGETELTNYVELLLSTLVQGNLCNARSVLADFCAENVHARLTPENIWNRLEEAGFRKQPLFNDASLMHNIREHTVNSFRNWEWVTSTPFEHPGLKQVFEVIEEKPPRVVFLTGSAGAGKTGVLKQVVDQCSKKDIPCLYLSVDANVLCPDPQVIGQQIGLPDSPATSLAGYAGHRHCVLLLDQLDAVSAISGQHPEFLDCVERIVKDAEVFGTVTVILACRDYDFEKDYRFQQIKASTGAKRITIAGINSEFVQVILENMNISSTEISKKFLDFYSIPLHLYLLKSILDAGELSCPRLLHQEELFSKYWAHMRYRVNARLGGRQNEFGAVVDTILDRQLSFESYWVPLSCVIDDYYGTVNAMLTEGLLQDNGNQIGFSHQSIADYVLGRRYVAQDRNLKDFLCARVQHLRDRRIVRQYIREQRQLIPKKYRHTLSQLLRCKGIRYHIKKTALEMIANFDNPKENEWDLLREFLENYDKIIARDIRIALWNSPAWLSFLVDKGYLKSCLESSDEIVQNATMRALCDFAQHFPNQAADHLEPLIGRSDEWESKLWQYLTLSPGLSERKLFDIFLQLLERGYGAANGGHEFWLTIQSLSDDEPARAAEAVGKYFMRRAKNLPAKTEVRLHFLQEDDFSVGVLLTIATKAPAAFAENVFPFFLKVLNQYADPADLNEDGLIECKFWGLRIYGERAPFEIEGAILVGLEKALQHLAEHEPEEFQSYEQRLRKTNYEPVNFLLVRAYTAGVKHFANTALDYLCEKPGRMHCGWAISGASGGGASYWAAHELIKAIAPKCDARKLRKLRRRILNYVPTFEKRNETRNVRGFAQFVLLSAIPEQKHDESSHQKLKELQRKFEKTPPLPEPSEGAAEFVGSPIPEDRIDKMTEQDWLSAIARYQQERHEISPENSLKGGPHELSKELEKRIKENPKRFSSLVQKIPLNSNAAYFNSILRGLAAAESPDKNDIFQVVRYCHQIPDRPCGRWIGDPVTKCADEEIPRDILEIVSWYADNDPDPSEEMWRPSSGKGTTYFGGNILDAGINSVRGHIANTIGKLIWGRQDRVAFFNKQIKNLCTDPIVAVRAEAASILLGLLNIDREQAVSIFEKLCNTEEDRLFNTRFVENFIKYSPAIHFDRVQPVLKRMIGSSFPEVRETGSRLIAIVQFEKPGASALVEECMNSKDAYLRTGCAQVAAANVMNESCQNFCREALPRLLQDEEKQVRDEAASFLLNLTNDAFGDYHNVIKSLCESPAFPDNTRILLFTLKKSTARLPEDITFDIIERLIDLESDSKNGGCGFHDMTTSSELLFRIYRQTDDEEVEKKSLDLLDNMLRTGMWGVDRQLKEFDR